MGKQAKWNEFTETEKNDFRNNNKIAVENAVCNIGANLLYFYNEEQKQVENGLDNWAGCKSMRPRKETFAEYVARRLRLSFPYRGRDFQTRLVYECAKEIYFD